jgi:Tfp pilus assembly protein PilX
MMQHRYKIAARKIAARRSQRGVTLVVGMIMLVLITLVVLASFHLSRNNLEIVGNAQQRNDALTAAQQTIEAAVNSPLLTSNPTSIFPTPCPGWPANTLCYDVNGDGTNDVVVQITPTPTCVKAQVITNNSLTNTKDQTCRTQQPQSCFGQGGPCNDSNCANSVWDIRAVAQNLAPNGTSAASQGPTAVVNQGIANRVAKSEVATSCP